MAIKDSDHLPSYDEATNEETRLLTAPPEHDNAKRVVHIALLYTRTGDRSSYTARKNRTIMLRPDAKFEDCQFAIKALWQAERGSFCDDNAASWYSWFLPSSSSDRDRIVLCERTWPELRERILHHASVQEEREPNMIPPQRPRVFTREPKERSTPPQTSVDRTFAFRPRDSSVVRVETRLLSTFLEPPRPRHASDLEEMGRSYRNNELDLLLQGRVVPEPKMYHDLCALQ